MTSDVIVVFYCVCVCVYVWIRCVLLYSSTLLHWTSVYSNLKHFYHKIKATYVWILVILVFFFILFFFWIFVFWALPWFCIVAWWDSWEEGGRRRPYLHGQDYNVLGHRCRYSCWTRLIRIQNIKSIQVKKSTNLKAHNENRTQPKILNNVLLRRISLNSYVWLVALCFVFVSVQFFREGGTVRGKLYSIVKESTNTTNHGHGWTPYKNIYSNCTNPLRISRVFFLCLHCCFHFEEEKNPQSNTEWSIHVYICICVCIFFFCF